jgi:ATP-dependent helicase HrpB
MAALAVHPRLSHMMLRGQALGHGAVACDLAALLDERDILRADGGGPPDADVRLRLELLREGGRGERGGPPLFHGYQVDRDTARRVRVAADQWRRQLGVVATARTMQTATDDPAGLLLAFAYPDRIAQGRPGQPGRFLLRNGRGAAFAAPQPLSTAPYVVAADLDGRERESRIFLAAPVSLDDIEAHFADQLEAEALMRWDGELGAVRAQRRTRLGAIVLREAPLRDPDPELVTDALLDGLAAEGVGALPWTPAARRVQERVLFMRALDPTWPDVSDEALAATLREWLRPHLYGMRRRDDVQRLDLADVLRGALGWAQRAALDELAPTHVTVPSGSRVPIDYSDPGAPVLAVRLQEMFGATDTPRIAGGAVPLTLHLLSPAHRPVQVTRDLGGFWRTTYFDVRKDLRGRYPKHHWPDDPLQAEPTRRAKPRR